VTCAPRALLAVLLASTLAGPAWAARPKKAPPRPRPPATAPATTGAAPRVPERPDGPGGMDPRAVPDASGDASGVPGGRRGGPARIEFDDRLVQGQTNKANAIYLFERRESALRSLLKKRAHFHDEIDETLEEELMR
jgi:hypothetical protein